MGTKGSLEALQVLKYEVLDRFKRTAAEFFKPSPHNLKEGEMAFKILELVRKAEYERARKSCENLGIPIEELEKIVDDIKSRLE